MAHPVIVATATLPELLFIAPCKWDSYCTHFTESHTEAQGAGLPWSPTATLQLLSPPDLSPQQGSWPVGEALLPSLGQRTAPAGPGRVLCLLSMAFPLGAWRVS